MAEPESGDAELNTALKHIHQCPDCRQRIGYLVRALNTDTVDKLSCHICQERLPEYVSVAAAARADTSWRAVTLHLAICPQCAAAYDELIELIALAQGERGLEPPPYSVPALSFLDPTKSRPWYLEGLNRLVIEFTSELLAGLRMAGPALAPVGLKADAPAAVLQPFTLVGEVEDQDVIISVEPARGEPARWTVIVQVDIPSRGGWPNLGGTLVTLGRGAATLGSQATDDFGTAVFERIATDDLGRLVFVIEREASA
jgi:hypothetical protein